MKKKILVTGACGFIGSHLVEKLAKKNKYDVTALCYYNSSNSIGNLSYIHKKLLKKIKIIFGWKGTKSLIELFNFGSIFRVETESSIPFSRALPTKPYPTIPTFIKELKIYMTILD